MTTTTRRLAREWRRAERPRWRLLLWAMGALAAVVALAAALILAQEFAR